MGSLPVGLSTTRGGWIEVIVTVQDGLTCCVYDQQGVVLAIGAGLVAIVVGWLIQRFTKKRALGWAVIGFALVAVILTIPNWVIEKVEFDQEKFLWRKAYWCVPQTVELRWSETDHLELVEVDREGPRRSSRRTEIRSFSRDGEATNWGSISGSPMIGEVIEEILSTARKNGVKIQETEKTVRL